jgi:hypothetical protein
MAAVGGAVFASYLIGARNAGKLGSLPDALSFFLGKGGEGGLYHLSLRAFLRVGWDALCHGKWAPLALTAGAAAFARRPAPSAGARLALAWAGVYAVFFTVFEPENIYFRTLLFPPLALLLGEAVPAGRRAWAGAFLAAAAVLQLRTEIPLRMAEADPSTNAPLQTAIAWGRASSPGDFILLRDAGDPTLKFYVALFGGRTPAPVERFWVASAADPRQSCRVWMGYVRAAGGRVFVQDAAREAASAFLPEGASFRPSGRPDLWELVPGPS